MEALEEDVTNAADRFEAAATTAALHTLTDLKTKPSDRADRDELTKNYTQRMARKGTPGKDEYDKIKSATPFGRCPLCGHRDVETIDHQLPKKAYPLLAVVPANLVPACRSCNTVKGESEPKIAEDQTLHPYFDDIGKEQWLFATVHEVAPAFLEFFIVPPPAWDNVLTKRALGHFHKFGLASLYGSQAAQEMSGLRHILKRKVPSTVGEYLRDEAMGLAEASPNLWRTAMYQALAENSWYVDGGFAID
ncbi:HNH endonuclease [Actinacidiphila sp. ITFR-21]|uniref:HNH endonuclease n=1 Tax=Actinacidiphila sp. ITFR-21 TaxID=3075199 RepID=UPI00288B9D8C|nr:hypothetical protein [Streptomyces sp. ITFR-21]WNI16214.1 hypothetical protein RLT57_12175 [Streptomyces sp. ITFR-21]